MNNCNEEIIKKLDMINDKLNWMLLHSSTGFPIGRWDDLDKLMNNNKNTYIGIGTE